MPYESMPDLAELLREAGVTDSFFAPAVLTGLPTMPETAPERTQRSATFIAALCDLIGTDDPEVAFRDALREMQHASVEFGVNWTEEDRFGWVDVHQERARIGCPGHARGR